MAIIHMISGPVGVGKTTYSIKLATKLNAVRFSIDDWLTPLFFADNPEPVSYEWAVERAIRCEKRIAGVSFDVLKTGADVIWDLGCMELDQRERLYTMAQDTPYAIRLHVLEAPADLRRERVRHRNVKKTDGYVMDVTDEMIDFMDARSITATADEIADIVFIDTRL